MLLYIAGIIVILWIIGLVAHVAGGFIHILLLVALAVLLYHFVVRHRKA